MSTRYRFPQGDAPSLAATVAAVMSALALAAGGLLLPEFAPPLALPLLTDALLLWTVFAAIAVTLRAIPSLVSAGVELDPIARAVVDRRGRHDLTSAAGIEVQPRIGARGSVVVLDGARRELWRIQDLEIAQARA